MAPVTAAVGEVFEQHCGAGPPARETPDPARLGFGSFWTARRPLAGYAAMAMIRQGQVRNTGGSDIKAQATFIAELFEMAA